MKNHDALSGYTSGSHNDETLSAQELSLLFDDGCDELRKAKRKLERTKKKGKDCKKLKKKIKKLKKNKKQLKARLETARQQPIRGRWDGLIENSVPEIIKLTMTIVDRKLPPAKNK